MKITQSKTLEKDFLRPNNYYREISSSPLVKYKIGTKSHKGELR